jgi:hypothetical protein
VKYVLTPSQDVFLDVAVGPRGRGSHIEATSYVPMLLLRFSWRAPDGLTRLDVNDRGVQYFGVLD